MNPNFFSLLQESLLLKIGEEISIILDMNLNSHCFNEKINKIKNSLKV